MEGRDHGFAAFLVVQANLMHSVGATGKSITTYPISPAMRDTADSVRIGELVLVLWRNPGPDYSDGSARLTHHHQRQDRGIYMGLSADRNELRYRLVPHAELRAERAALERIRRRRTGDRTSMSDAEVAADASASQFAAASEFVNQGSCGSIILHPATGHLLGMHTCGPTTPVARRSTLQSSPWWPKSARKNPQFEIAMSIHMCIGFLEGS